MITWMQEFLGKHHRYLLAALLVVIIGSFVFAQYAAPDRGRSGVGKYLHSTANGVVNLCDERTTRAAREYAVLARLGDFGFPRRISADDLLHIADLVATREAQQAKADPEAYQAVSHYAEFVSRLALADSLHIPNPDAKQLQEHIRSKKLFFGANRAFDPVLFKRYTEIARDQLHLTEAAVERALANDWRVKRMRAVSVPADAPALDALATRRRDLIKTRWTIAGALYDFSKYTVDPKPDEKAVAAYFDANKEDYRVPERVKLCYAKVPGVAIPDTVKPLDEELLATARRDKAAYPTVDTTPTPEFLATHRAELDKAWRAEKAGDTASFNLSEKLAALAPEGAKHPSDAEYADLANRLGVTLVDLPEFGADSIPEVAGLPREIVAIALNLSTEKWHTSPIAGRDCAYVFFHKATVPSRIPALAEVKTAATNDWMKSERVKSFDLAAKAKGAEIAAAVKSGKSFRAAVESAGLDYREIKPFVSTEAPESVAVHLDALLALKPGEVSGMVRQHPDRAIFHIVSREVLPVEPGEKTIAEQRLMLGRAAAASSTGDIPDFDE